MAKDSPISYLPGTDPETVKANLEYQNALANLNSALDVRKNRLFDPALASFAAAMLEPGHGGSFGEALGRSVRAYSAGEEADIKQQQEIAASKMDVAAKGVELQRQKMYMDPYIKRMQGGPQPSGLPSSAGATEGAMSHDDFVMDRVLKGKTPAEAEAEYAKYIQDIIQVSDTGAYNRLTSKYTPHRYKVDLKIMDLARPDGSIERREVPEELASQIEAATQSGNLVEYKRLVARALNPLAAFQQSAPSPVATQPSAGALPIAAKEPPAGPLSTAAPQVPATTAPLSVAAPAIKPAPKAGELPVAPSYDERLERQRQQEIEKSSQTRLAEKRAETSAAREAELPKIEQNARLLYGSATRVIDNVTKSPNYYGLFERPGFVAAIGTLVDNLKGTKEGSVERGTVEKAMRQVMPGVEQTDLDAVTNTAAELANIELAYTQLYLTNQGAVTEGERRIVGKLGGSTSNSANVLKARMHLLKERSQYDIDRVEAFRQWQEKNLGGTIDQFERSRESKDLKTAFEVRLSKVFGGAPAIPSSERKASEQTKPKDNLEDLRKKLNKWRSSNG